MNRITRTMTAAILAFLLLLMNASGISAFAEEAPSPTAAPTLNPAVAYDPNTPSMLYDDQLSGTSCIVIDGVSGEILYNKNANVRVYPASTTKIMTLLLAMESGWSLDLPVQIPAEAGDIPDDSSLIPVYRDETTTFGSLLYGMMLHSGNDGANAIAVLIAGSVPAFVERMNLKAVELGCTGTHFSNVHGYHAEDHYTTAADLARITRAAMAYPEVRTIVSTYKHTIEVKPRGEITLYNSNSLINPSSSYYYEYCTGVKTGTHSQAGYCLVSSAEKDGVQLIAVTMNASSDALKYSDSKRLLEYGFSCYSELTLEQMFDQTNSRIVTVRISNAAENDPQNGVLPLKLAQISDSSYVRLIRNGEASSLDEALNDFAQRAQVTIDDTLAAPITEGKYVGTFSYTAQDGRVITASLIAGRSIEAQPEKLSASEVFPFLNVFSNPLFRVLLLVLLVLLIVIIVHRSVEQRRQDQRREELYRRRRHRYEEKQPSAQPRKKNHQAAKKKSRKRDDYEDDLFDGF